MSQNQAQTKLAVLIDADNAQPAILDGLIAEIAKYGVASVKRIYGDWTNPKLKGWKELLLENAIHPIQQFEYTSGKNSSDSAMLIDAMDLLYTEKLDGFCIVSSDSDFTRLASRIREAGLMVLGFGERKTPRPFVNACDKFVYTEILRKDDPTTASKKKRTSVAKLRSDTKLVNLLRGAVENAAGESGWAYLGNVGHSISNQAPEFDPRNYGYTKLGELMKALGLFEINERSSDNSPAKSVYVRDIRKKSE